LGSTAEGVVKKAEMPVMVFKNHAENVFGRILYAHDFSESAQKIMKYVKFIAKKCDSDVLVVHVLEKGEVVEEDVLESVEKELEAEGIRVKVLLGQGSPHKEIVNIANKENATSIFMGSSGRGLRELLGSTADFVIRYSKIPVFVSKV
jgi:nucleotide-binding universal stress UspA family protein